MQNENKRLIYSITDSDNNARLRKGALLLRSMNYDADLFQSASSVCISLTSILEYPIFPRSTMVHSSGSGPIPNMKNGSQARFQDSSGCKENLQAENLHLQSQYVWA